MVEKTEVDFRTVRLVAQCLSHALQSPLNGIERKLGRLRKLVTESQFSGFYAQSESILQQTSECRRIILSKRDVIRKHINTKFGFTSEELSEFIDRSLGGLIAELFRSCRNFNREFSHAISEQKVIRLSREIELSAQHFHDIYTGIKRFVASSVDISAERESCDLRTYISACYANFKVDDFESFVVNGNGKVQVNRTLLRLLLIEVLTNSVKYKKGLLDVKIDIVPIDSAGEGFDFSKSSYPSQFLIIIADNGIGIDPEDLDEVFELGFRSGEVKERIEGTGSGLSICKYFIEKSGGKIWIESRFRSGTQVYITLPAR